MRANQWQYRYELNAGKPVDCTEWGMTPQTHLQRSLQPLNNEIRAFVAVLAVPGSVDADADDALVYELRRRQRPSVNEFTHRF
jgi:predicted metalloendopeptidase